MIYITGGGGGSPKNPLATIYVTYPQGSECTCTNGVKTFKANNTIGACMFYPNAEGEWTIACTDGTSSTSTTVNVESGGVYSVSLAYILKLITAGVLDSNYSATGFTYNSGGYQYLYKAKPSSGTSNLTGVFSPAIDMSGFKTLKVKMKVNRTNSFFFLRDSDGNQSLKQTCTSTAKEYNIDVSELTGLHNVCGQVTAAASASGDYTGNLYIYDLSLE